MTTIAAVACALRVATSVLLIGVSWNSRDRRLLLFAALLLACALQSLYSRFGSVEATPTAPARSVSVFYDGLDLAITAGTLYVLYAVRFASTRQRRLSNRAISTIGQGHHPARSLESQRDADQRAIKELQISEERLRLISEATADGSWDWSDVSSQAVWWSPRLYELLGYKPGEIEATVDSFYGMYHPDDRKLFDGYQRDSLGSHTPFDQEFRLRTKSGEYRWFRARGKTLFDESDKPVRMCGSVQDITERRLAEAEVREIDHFREALIRTAAVGICVLVRDPAGGHTRFSIWNEQMVAITGYAVDEVNVPSFLELLVPKPERLARAAARIERLWKGEHFRNEPGVIKRKDGSTRFIEISSSLVSTDQGKDTIVVVVLDVTGRRLLEEQTEQLRLELAHVARLSVLGQMLAGIIHEISQPLFAIQNYAQACATVLESAASDSQPEIRTWIHKVTEQGGRIGAILGRLREFARNPSTKKTQLRVDELVQEAAELNLAEMRRSGIDLQLDLAENAPTVHGDRVQIVQVLVNLLKNACEALALPGTSTRTIIVTTAAEEGRVHFSVADTGSGLPQVEFNKLFEPFFTTKEHGLGMGLAVSRSIVEAAGGRMWAEPNTQAGAILHFTISSGGRPN